MQGGKEKKLTVMTKNVQAKKPHLEIDTHHENDKMASTHPLPAHMDDAKQNNILLPNVLTSPTAFKTTPPGSGSDLHELEPGLKKPQQPMQKKTSLKEPPPAFTKVQPPSKPTLNGFVSPKGLPKDKVLTSYTSQRNLGVGVTPKIEKKESHKDPKAAKIQQLQKIVEESRLKHSELSVRQGELVAQLQKTKLENSQLQAQAAELRKKVQKYKQSNEETKKMLKQRIHSFNQEGGQMQALRAQIKTLQERVESLLQQNQVLKGEVTQLEAKIEAGKEGELSRLGSLASSAVREVHLNGSRVSQLYLKQSPEQRNLLQFANLQQVEQNLDLQSYITEQEESYLQEYRSNVEVFDSIKREYQNIVSDIEIRYKAMAQDFQNAAAAQATEINSLQARIDDLIQQRDGRPALSLSMDEAALRSQKQIASLTLTVFELRAANQQLLEDVERHRAQCRFLSAELDIQRLKRQFKNENDKFEYNVVKLNLLGIIDKLKSHIDAHKQRYDTLHHKYTALKTAPR